MKKTIVSSLAFSLLIAALAVPAMAQEAEVTMYTTAAPVKEIVSEEAMDLATSEEAVDGISDEELLEAEPSDLPPAEEDEELTERMYGKMLLDVEGNGEVYYVDPVTGGKEYLADGTSAHRLLERRALGITEANFAKLIQGDVKEDSSICDESLIGERLSGRIVLRVEENGEAYWINPDNCRAYYAGTFDAAYALMRDLSTGIKKDDLAKVRNNERQRVKSAYRYAVYAYAEDNDLDLATSRDELKDDITAMRDCMKEAGFASRDKKSFEERLAQVKTCATATDMPTISKERREEIKATIKAVREENSDESKTMKQKIKAVANRVRANLKKGMEKMKEKATEMKEKIMEKRKGQSSDDSVNNDDSEESEDYDSDEVEEEDGDSISDDSNEEEDGDSDEDNEDDEDDSGDSDDDDSDDSDDDLNE